jgi:hypothetical protein
MVNLKNEKYHSRIGFRTLEYLGFLNFLPQCIRYVFITRTHKPELGYILTSTM